MKPATVFVMTGSRCESEMKSREIDVHIDELVLHHFGPETRWNIGDAVETELRGLLTEKGIPNAWLSSPERIDAGTISATSLTRPAAAGAQIAGAVYRGGGAR